MGAWCWGSHPASPSFLHSSVSSPSPGLLGYTGACAQLHRHGAAIQAICRPAVVPNPFLLSRYIFCMLYVVPGLGIGRVQLFPGFWPRPSSKANRLVALLVVQQAAVGVHGTESGGWGVPATRIACWDPACKDCAVLQAGE